MTTTALTCWPCGDTLNFLGGLEAYHGHDVGPELAAVSCGEPACSRTVEWHRSHLATASDADLAAYRSVKPENRAGRLLVRCVLMEQRARLLVKLDGITEALEDLDAPTPGGMS